MLGDIDFFMSYVMVKFIHDIYQYFNLMFIFFFQTIHCTQNTGIRSFIS